MKYVLLHNILIYEYAITVVAACILGAFASRVHGMPLELDGQKLSNEKTFGAFLMLAACHMVTGSGTASLLFALLYRLGAAPAHGEWYNFNDPEHTWRKRLAMLTLRGLWFVPAYLALGWRLGNVWAGLWGFGLCLYGFLYWIPVLLGVKAHTVVSEYAKGVLCILMVIATFLTVIISMN